VQSSPLNQLPTKRSQAQNHLELLITLIVLLVVQSFLSNESYFQRALFNILFLAVVLSAIRTLSESRTRLVAAMTAGIIAYALSWFAEARPSIALATVTDFCYIAVFGALFIALAESVFRDGPIDLNRIVGAVSIYLVLGLIWAFLYSLLETIQPGSFALSRQGIADHAQMNLVSEFIYFSIVTLTTLGYGDIAPLSRPARMFATLEAITGQLYVAIVIARLVGLQITQNRSKDS
jgi:hypothetical protein